MSESIAGGQQELMAYIAVGVVRITIFGATEPMFATKIDADTDAISAQSVAAARDFDRRSGINGYVVNMLFDVQVRVAAKCIGNDMVADRSAETKTGV